MGTRGRPVAVEKIESLPQAGTRDLGSVRTGPEISADFDYAT